MVVDASSGASTRSPPLFTYLSIVLPLIAPVAALHSIVWGPLTHGTARCR